MSSKERKQWKKTWCDVGSAIRTDPVPSHRTIARRAVGQSLRTLLKHEKRFGTAAVKLLRGFSVWRAEVPESLSDSDWPDARLFNEVSLCYASVANEIQKRRPEFVALTIETPQHTTNQVRGLPK